MGTERRRSGQASPAFTLIEAVVALLIVSLGMLAVFTQLGQFASNSSYIQDKTLASWIASNRLTELSLQDTWPELGNEEDEIEYAGREWRYAVEISETEVENLRRADVSVSLLDDPERVLHTVSALIEPPAPRGFAPLRWLSVDGAGGAFGTRSRPPGAPAPLDDANGPQE